MSKKCRTHNWKLEGLLCSIPMNKTYLYYGCTRCNILKETEFKGQLTAKLTLETKEPLSTRYYDN